MAVFEILGAIRSPPTFAVGSGIREIRRMQKRFVVCIDNSDFAVSLEVRKIYEVVPDATAKDLDQIRIIDESGEGYLYPTSRFIEISLSEPAIAALSSAAQHIQSATIRMNSPIPSPDVS